MKLVALMPVRNEQWVLEASIHAALKWVDALVILDHDSEDATPEIIREAVMCEPGRVKALLCGGEWDEMEHRQVLLEAGRKFGGTHFAIVDADEILTANALGDIRYEIGELEPGECLDVPMIPVWGDLTRYRSDDCVWTRAWLTIAFCDSPHLSWRPRVDGYQHHHRSPFGALVPSARAISPSLERGHGGVMHLQFADPPRIRAKHALYKMQEVLRWPEREPVGAVDWKYSQALDETGRQLTRCPASWWQGYLMEAISLGDTPWQKAKCVELVREHGAERFEGLELWNQEK